MPRMYGEKCFHTILSLTEDIGEKKILQIWETEESIKGPTGEGIVGPSSTARYNSRIIQARLKNKRRRRKEKLRRPSMCPCQGEGKVFIIILPKYRGHNLRGGWGGGGGGGGLGGWGGGGGGGGVLYWWGRVSCSGAYGVFFLGGGGGGGPYYT